MRMNIVKGIRRLVLSATALCGVGLFLFSSDVKAAATPVITIEKSADVYIVKFQQDSADPKDTVYDLGGEIYITAEDSGPKVIGKIDAPSVDAWKYTKVANAGDADPVVEVARFTEQDIIDKSAANTTYAAEVDGLVTTGGTQLLIGARADIKVDGGSANPFNSTSQIPSKTIYKVTATANDNGTALGTVTAAVNVNSKGVDYGFSGQSYAVAVSFTGSTAITAYKQNVYRGSTAPANWYTSVPDSVNGWESAASTISGGSYKIGDTSTANEIKVIYFPKIDTALDLKISADNGTAISPVAASAAAKVHIVKETTPVKSSFDFTYTLKAVSNLSADNALLAGLYIKPVDSLSTSANIASFGASTTGAGDPVTVTIGGTGDGNNALSDKGATVGVFKTKFKIYHNPGSEVDTGVYVATDDGTASVYTLASVYPCVDTLTVDSTTVYVQKNGTAKVTVTGTPAAVDWDVIMGQAKGAGIDAAAAGGTTTGLSLDSISRVAGSPNKLEMTFRADSTVSTNQSGVFQINITERSYPIGTRILHPTPNDGKITIKVDAIDETKTKEEVKKQGYITIGYSLDLNELFTKSVKGASGTLFNQAPTSIAITANSSLVEKTGNVIKGKEKGKVTVTATWGTTSIDFPIFVYPKPEISLITESGSNKNRLELSIPAGISRGYGAEKNISEAKGYYLELLNNNGDVIYSYDTSKFQNVISECINSSSTRDKYKFAKTETTSGDAISYKIYVPASDVEAMITGAASAGKFSTSSETSTVTFRMTPMGIQAGTDTTIKAHGDFAVKTSGHTVYRIKASGANFNDSYAFGLSGQTVNITASPASGYKFTKWEDGNTSNPRSVTVSGAATYGVLGEKTTGGAGGAAGTGGKDNSGLYDDVPKTSESNSAIWLIVFMVFAVIGVAYALYIQLKAATSRNGR